MATVVPEWRWRALDVETELNAGRGLALLEAAGKICCMAAGEASAVSQFLVIGLNMRVGVLSARGQRPPASDPEAPMPTRTRHQHATASD